MKDIEKVEAQEVEAIPVGKRLIRKSGTIKLKLTAGKQLKIEILAYTSMVATTKAGQISNSPLQVNRKGVNQD